MLILFYFTFTRSVLEKHDFITGQNRNSKNLPVYCAQLLVTIKKKNSAKKKRMKSSECIQWESQAQSQRLFKIN
jgi:hypothetical protein